MSAISRESINEQLQASSRITFVNQETEQEEERPSQLAQLIQEARPILPESLLQRERLIQREKEVWQELRSVRIELVLTVRQREKAFKLRRVLAGRKKLLEAEFDVLQNFLEKPQQLASEQEDESEGLEKPKKTVSFGVVETRFHNVVLGSHPNCNGAPLELGWYHFDSEVSEVPVTNDGSRDRSETFMLSPGFREEKLIREGFPKEKIDAVIAENQKLQEEGKRSNRQFLMERQIELLEAEEKAQKHAEEEAEEKVREKVRRKAEMIEGLREAVRKARRKVDMKAGIKAQITGAKKFSQKIQTFSNKIINAKRRFKKLVKTCCPFKQTKVAPH